MKAVYFLGIFLLLAVCKGAPAPQETAESDAESIDRAVEIPEEQSKAGNDLIPIDFGSVIGEVVVGTDFFNVQRAKPKSKQNDGPSFSPFISSPGISLSVGTPQEDPSKRPPINVNGATLVFNHEAAITEIL